jgi:uncharacterized LabA/DUF88 family protein
MAKTAILVDGGFYHRRAQGIWGDISPEDRAKELIKYCQRHLRDNYEHRELYRIFYYDCPPLSKKIYHPLTQRQIDLGKTSLYQWMTQFQDELKKKRKVALRLGKLDDKNAHYILRPGVLKRLCRREVTIDDLKEEDFSLEVKQKGVDNKIGTDIASMALKKQVTQMILIAGDSDFVPSAKLARREGIDFILDPMWWPIKPDLHEHIDGLKTQCPNPNRPSNAQTKS